MAGLDPSPPVHIKEYSRQHPAVGIALGDLGHDAAAAAVRDGKVLFAIEEERLNRHKHYMGSPRLAVGACAKAAGVAIDAMKLSYYLDPSNARLTERADAFTRVLGSEVRAAVEGDFAHVQALIAEAVEPWHGVQPVNHHLAHAASAFYLSGFSRSLVLVIDGQGESASTTLMLGDERGLHPIKQYPITSSLGILYAAVTAYVGFEPIEDEYKVMGLAAYGTSDDYRAFFDEIIIEEQDGGFSIPSLLTPARARLPAWMRKLGAPRFSAEQPIEPRHIAIAYSLQKAVEPTVLRLLEHHESRLKTRHLCLAGGVALNCSMNGVLDRSTLFDALFVQPAANDPGAALGSAVHSYYDAHPEGPRHRMEHTYLGPSYDDADVRRALAEFAGKVTWTKPNDYIGAVADLLAEGKVFGWFQGRMEFRPRALGNRSIRAVPI